METGYHSSMSKEESSMVSEMIASRVGLSKGPVQHEHKLKRQIANSNERKRIQTINAGFQSLRTLLPITGEEKLSKAAILHHAVQFIMSLMYENQKLTAANRDGIPYIEQIPTPPVAKRLKLDSEILISVSKSEDGNRLKVADSRLNCEVKREPRIHRNVESAEQCQNNLQTSLCIEFPIMSANELQTKVQPSRIPQRVCRQPSDEVTSTSNISPELLHSSSTAADRQISCLNTRPHSRTPSLAQRNLGIIVEAIRHLEGHDALFNADVAHNVYVGHSEDSEHDCSSSEHDDFAASSDKKRLSDYCDLSPSSCY